MFRRALFSESRAVVRLLHALEDKPTDANRRLLCVDFFNVEQPFRIVIPEFITEFKTTLGDRSDAAPFAIANFEDLVDQILRHAVSVALITGGY